MPHFLKKCTATRRGKGLYYFMQGYELPKIVYRVYSFLQPVRCLFNYHDLWGKYGVTSCQSCHRKYYHSTDIILKYRWRPWMRKLATEYENYANYSIEVFDCFYSSVKECFTEDAEFPKWQEDMYSSLITEMLKMYRKEQ